MREEVDGKISDLSDGLSDLVYQKEALQEEIDAHFLASISILKVKNKTFLFFILSRYTWGRPLGLSFLILTLRKKPQ
jgi:hypothetical protein